MWIPKKPSLRCPQGGTPRCERLSAHGETVPSLAMLSLGFDVVHLALCNICRNLLLLPPPQWPLHAGSEHVSWVLCPPTGDSLEETSHSTAHRASIPKRLTSSNHSHESLGEVYRTAELCILLTPTLWTILISAFSQTIPITSKSPESSATACGWLKSSIIKLPSN